LGGEPFAENHFLFVGNPEVIRSTGATLNAETRCLLSGVAVTLTLFVLARPSIALGFVKLV
jgi:hypothetical protein